MNPFSLYDKLAHCPTTGKAKKMLIINRNSRHLYQVQKESEKQAEIRNWSHLRNKKSCTSR